MNHASSNPAEASKPWYRHGYLWLVIILPTIVVIAAFVTLYIAINNADDTVSEDWYKDGRTVNRSWEADQQAARLGIEVELDFTGAAPRAQLTSQVPFPPPESLQVNLRHPAFANQDISLTLTHTGNGEYRGQGDVHPTAEEMIATIVSADGHWRIQQRAHLDDGKASLVSGVR